MLMYCRKTNRNSMSFKFKYLSKLIEKQANENKFQLNEFDNNGK